MLTVVPTTGIHANKRLPKIEAKIMKKQRQSVWSLMPYVNESLLDKNMKDSSGIQRLWEDESIHVNLNNLTVNEPGVITR